MIAILQDGEEIEFTDRSQRWLASWHPPADPPIRKRHGSTGICQIPTGEIVLISQDGQTWDFPGGRPEGEESWEETLKREMMEEACARVTTARLLGFSVGKCIEGHEQGLVLVRAVWHAQVELLDWIAEFETTHRKTAPPSQSIPETPAIYHPMWRRAFADAGF